MNLQTILSALAASLVGGGMVAGVTVATAQQKAPYDLDKAPSQVHQTPAPMNPAICDKINTRAADAGSAQALLLLANLSERMGCDPAPLAEHILSKR